jgi:hypothetical protein
MNVSENSEETDNIYKKNHEYAVTMKHTDFTGRMDEQMEVIKSLMDNVTDEELTGRNVKLAWGENKILGEAIMETAVKWLSAYKMQLYLYMKMNGVKLDTGDCWIETA